MSREIGIQPSVQLVPIPDNEFHQLVKEVCAGRSVDERYGQIEDWDVSQVRNMSNAFKDQKHFNRDISKWNTSNVCSMIGMFNNATSFNQQLNNWNVSNVTDMTSMFSNATPFNQALNDWNVSVVVNICLY